MMEKCSFFSPNAHLPPPHTSNTPNTHLRNHTPCVCSAHATGTHSTENIRQRKHFREYKFFSELILQNNFSRNHILSPAFAAHTLAPPASPACAHNRTHSIGAKEHRTLSTDNTRYRASILLSKENTFYWHIHEHGPSAHACRPS